MIAITRKISDSLGCCELTHLERVPIDLQRARQQHSVYVDVLRSAGCDVIELDAALDLPDCVFVEDAAVALDEVAVLTRPGAESRRGELAAIESALAPLRTLRRIEAPGTLDGGDVLVLGRDVYVGLSSRSNEAGVEQLRRHLDPFEYRVHGIEVR
ncbi:MAG: arginine deiminase family protein, partial [Planctomycetota bacterium]